MKSRRKFIAILAGATSISGCIGPTQQDTNGNDNEDSSDIKRMQGEGETIEVHKDFSQTNVTYVSKNNTVKIISGYKSVTTSNRKSDQKPVYDETEFDSWAMTKTGLLASNAVRGKLESEFEQVPHYLSITSGPSKSVLVSVDMNQLDSSEQEIQFNQLVAVTPRKVISSLDIDQKSYSRELTAYVVKDRITRE
nr:hypothetical protein [Haloferax larsenii]